VEVTQCGSVRVCPLYSIQGKRPLARTPCNPRWTSQCSHQVPVCTLSASVPSLTPRLGLSPVADLVCDLRTTLGKGEGPSE
jgi:hypothetical protein